MGIKAQDISYRFGVQSDRTTVAASLLDFAPLADDVPLAPSQDLVELNTDHGIVGEMYSDLAAQNRQEIAGKVPLYPTIAGTLFDAIFKRTSGGDLYYHTLERWWKSALGGSFDKGERYHGCIFNKFGVTFARNARNAEIVVDTGIFINARRRILTAETAPTYDHSKGFPFGSSGVLLDFVHDASVDSYGADDQDVRSVTLNFSNEVTLDGCVDNLSDAPLHRSWLVHAPGNPVMDVTVAVRINDHKYLNISEYTVVPKGKLRVGCVHPKCTSITSTSTVTSATTSNQVLLVSSTTGFTVGDMVLITHPTTGFCVSKVTAINAGVSLTISGYDTRVTLNGASGGPLTIRNMAFGLTIDRMDFVSRGSTRRDGAFQIVELKYKVKLLAGSTFPLEWLSYDHANSRIS